MAFNSCDAIGKGQARQLLAVDRAVWPQDLPPESTNYAFVSHRSRRIKLMGQFVGGKILGTSTHEHLPDGGLAAGDAARKSYAQHESPETTSLVVVRDGSIEFAWNVSSIVLRKR